MLVHDIASYSHLPGPLSGYLRWQLLRTQFKSRHHFRRQWFRIAETKRKQAYLSDQCIIRHHHRAWPEQSFQVVGKLRTSSIPGKREMVFISLFARLSVSFLQWEESFTTLILSQQRRRTTTQLSVSKRERQVIDRTRGSWWCKRSRKDPGRSRCLRRWSAPSFAGWRAGW